MITSPFLHPSRFVAPALLAAVLLLSLAGGAARGQSNGGQIAELKQIVALRDAQEAGKPARVAELAQAYLKQHPEGRYADEAVLSLAEAQAGQGDAAAALKTYDRLIVGFPDSPFREQAMAESLPLLIEAGQRDAAFARVDTLAKNYPTSLHRDRALVWKGEVQYKDGAYEAAADTLQQVRSPEQLAAGRLTDYYRLLAMSLLQSGQSAWTPLNRYLKRKDTPERKAGVLVQVAAIAREAGRDEEALSYYRLLVDEYPVAAELPTALYWRARLYDRVKVEPAEGLQRVARAPDAIAYYTAYLQSGEEAHKAEVLARRGALRRELGLAEAALEDYEQALKLDPALRGDPGVMVDLVRLYADQGRDKEAMALLEQVRQDDTIDAEAKRRLRIEVAAVYYDDGKCAQVEQLLNPMPLFADADRRSRAAFMRGFCRYRQEEWEKATFDLEGLVNDPNYQDLVTEPLLQAYEASGQHSRLAHMTEELLSAGRLEPTADVLARLGRAYGALGESALMRATYQRLAKEHPEAAQTPAIQFALGKAEEGLGNTDAAIGHYTTVLDTVESAGTKPPPAAYLGALEQLHGLYLAQGDGEALVALADRAEPLLGEDPEAHQRLEAWRRDAHVAAGRKALEGGKPGEAAGQLTQAWEATPAEAHDARLRILPLLLKAHVQAGQTGQGMAVYEAEVERAQDETYKRQLAETVLQPLLTGGPGEGAGRKETIAFYEMALERLPHENREVRTGIADKLDAMYAEDGNFAARAALVTELLKDGLDDEAKDRLKVRKGRIYLEWGRHVAEAGQYEAASFHLERALALLGDQDWQVRYDVVNALSNALLHQQRYSELVQLNERMLPDIEDDALAAQVRHFVGQVYVEWGKAAEQEENWKSARIRYRYALDYLPKSDWQRRLAAANGLSGALRKLERPADAAAAYAEVIPDLPEGKTRQQYELYVGRLYHEQANEPAKAREWLQRADGGGNDPISLEAAYLLSELDVVASHNDAAVKRLEALVKRGLGKSKWRVPVHYRLAALYHQQQNLKAALKHYRIVAGEQSAELRKLYPRSIQQSRRLADEIADYLKASGGSQADIAVPAVRGD